MGPRHTVLNLAAALLLVAFAATPPVVDARVLSLFHSGRSLADTAATSASIKAAATKAKEAEQLAAKLSAGSTPKMKECLDVCRENFESAIDSLHDAETYLASSGKYAHANLMNELSATVSFVETCNDAFVEEPGLVSPIAATYKDLRKMVATSLNMASELP